MINNFKDNPVAAAYVAMYEKQNTVDELEEAYRGKPVKVVPVKPKHSYSEQPLADKLEKAGFVYGKVHSFDDPKYIHPKTGASVLIMRNGAAFAISAEDGSTLEDVTSARQIDLYLKKYGLDESVDESVDELEEATVKVERAEWVPEEISDEGVADFMGAAAAAAKKGDKTFKFGDKEYKVTMKKSTADAIDEDEVGYQDRYAVKDGKAVKDNPKSSSDKDQPYHVYADSPAHAVRKYAKESKTIGEGYSPQEIKQAIGIASDKRYAGGNMTGATSAIEKLKAGLSDHPQVKAVLKSKNEEVDLKEMTVDKAIANATSASMSDMATEIKKYATKNAGIDKAVFLRTAKLLDQGDMKGAIRYTLMQDTDPRDWLLTVMGITSIPRV